MVNSLILRFSPFVYSSIFNNGELSPVPKGVVVIFVTPLSFAKKWKNPFYYRNCRSLEE